MRLAMYQGPADAPDVDAAVASVAEAARAASAAGARLLVTPEMSLTGYNIGERARALAEPADGAYLHRMAEVARAHGLAVAYGYPERDGGTTYNATSVVDRDGTLLATYRKAHLYGDLDRGLFAPGGRGLVQLDLDGVRVGLLTCYDVEFPEPVRVHALSGTQLLVVPTGLMAPFELVSEVLVPARAYESQVFVAYVNRVGTEGELDYCGLSCLASPDGTVPVRAGRGEQLVLADVDPGVLERSRAVNTHLADRRTDLYPDLAASPTATPTEQGARP